MDIRAALRTFLLADATIAALVDDGAGLARIFPVKIPQGVKAASIVFRRISGTGDFTMQGPSGLSRPRLQVDAWAPTAEAANTLGQAVYDRLNGFRGTMGTGDNVATVQGVFSENEREDYDAAADLHVLGRDYLIFFEER